MANTNRKLEVYGLYFDAKNKTFSMSYCTGDSWGLVLECPLVAPPMSFQFQWDRVAISFERQEDADAFGAWLVEGEKKVQEGFRTMRG